MQSIDDQILQPGARLRSSDGRRTGEVQGLLGQGGQGAVYRVQFANQTLALKWYHVQYLEADPGLVKRLTKAIDRGAPDGRFLWPLELVYIDGQASFGYLMPLRSASCVGMISLLAPPSERIVLPLRKRLAVCLNIARSFYALHARGFCYQDVNFGNIFLFERTGEVLICDNDNVNIDGADASIYGTKKFMAPEVVRRDSLPNTRTDLYSMAVMFHYVLMGWHPLEGAREYAIDLLGTDDELKIYGTEPLFMFDRTDTSNAAVLPYHGSIVKRWLSLTPELRALFHRSFERGLADPYSRVVESEWIGLFESLEHATFECPQCHYEHAATIEVTGYSKAAELSAERLAERSSATSLAGTAIAQCVHCAVAIRNPPLLKIGRKLCVLEADRVIPNTILGNESAPSWESSGIVERHPFREGATGIRNLSESDWLVTPLDEHDIVVKPGETVGILDGLKIDFGGQVGHILA